MTSTRSSLETRLRLHLLLILAAIISTVVTASAQEPIRVGTIMVLTGQYAMQGAAFLEGIELAAEEVNSRGGIKGRKLELNVEDSANLANQALVGARKIVSGGGVVAAITSSYPELATAAKFFQQQRIPVVHLWDASPDIESMGDYIFGIGPWTPSAGEVTAQFAWKKLNAKRAVTFHVNDPWSELVTRYFEEDFKKLGGEVLRSFSFNPQEQDFRALFATARSLHPDVVYSPIGDNIVTFYTQLKRAKIEAPIVTSDVIADEHVRQSPDVFAGIYQSQIQDPAGAEMTKLAAAYEAKFKKPVALPWYVATGYDAVKLIAHCVEIAGVESTKVRDCIAGTKNFQGAGQKFSFNAGGSSPQAASIFKIKDNQFVLEWDGR